MHTMDALHSTTSLPTMPLQSLPLKTKDEDTDAQWTHVPLRQGAQYVNEIPIDQRLTVKFSFKAVRKVKCHQGAIRSIAFSKNELFIASAGDDGRISLFDLTTMSHGKLFKISSKSNPLLSVKFLSNNEIIACCPENVNYIKFTNDTLTTVATSQVILKNIVTTMGAANSSTLLNFYFTSLATDPTENMIIVGGSDGVCRILKRRSCALKSCIINVLPDDNDFVFFRFVHLNAGGVTSLSVSANGDTVLASTLHQGAVSFSLRFERSESRSINDDSLLCFNSVVDGEARKGELNKYNFRLNSDFLSPMMSAQFHPFRQYSMFAAPAPPESAMVLHLVPKLTLSVNEKTQQVEFKRDTVKRIQKNATTHQQSLKYGTLEGTAATEKHLTGTTVGLPLLSKIFSNQLKHSQLPYTNTAIDQVTETFLAVLQDFLQKSRVLNQSSQFFSPSVFPRIRESLLFQGSWVGDYHVALPDMNGFVNIWDVHPWSDGQLVHRIGNNHHFIDPLSHHSHINIHNTHRQETLIEGVLRTDLCCCVWCTEKLPLSTPTHDLSRTLQNDNNNNPLDHNCNALWMAFLDLYVRLMEQTMPVKVVAASPFHPSNRQQNAVLLEGFSTNSKSLRSEQARRHPLLSKFIASGGADGCLVVYERNVANDDGKKDEMIAPLFINPPMAY